VLFPLFPNWMLPKRYSLIVADRSTGVIRRFTLAVRPTVVLMLAVLALPVGWSVQSRRAATARIDQLQLQNATLEVENAGYRTASADLSAGISGLQLAMMELRDHSIVDPRVRRAMGRLPDNARDDTARALRSVALSSPTETFNLLRDLLNMLDGQLSMASAGVDHQQAFAAATPINLPSDGRVTGRYGYRPDPFTGERSFHPAVDISTGVGQPVFATADGTVDSAAASGAFGNLIEITHGFGLVTRYGHLSQFAAKVGDVVSRGDVIGYAGATGRATGIHVHYEVWVNGTPINPLQLGSEPRSQAAN
jgi:murein DD-endopeptidase MepM/ murein hydrolase activator NlpD